MVMSARLRLVLLTILPPRRRTGFWRCDAPGTARAADPERSMAFTLRTNGLLGLLAEGYDFAPRRFDRRGSDVFETRLVVVPATFLRGPRAGELFYDGERFRRQGALPPRIHRTLLGAGSVMSLDGPAHHHRKALLMSVMTPESIEDLCDRVGAGWSERIDRWQREDGQVELFTETGRLLCEAVCAWAGVPLRREDVARRTDLLHALIDSPAALGPRHWKGRVARRRTDRWIRRVIEDVRGGRLEAPAHSPLQLISSHGDTDGNLLGSEVAAVELINLLRPVVAIDRFVVFIAMALHAEPEWRRRLREGDVDLCRSFLQEVRRYYPFFPMTGAVVRRSFEWEGVQFPEGRLVLFDLYGTDHHAPTWGDPERFRPERFAEREPGSFDLVPQGGGDHHSGHRCAGEWVTIGVMERAVRVLTEEMDYRVPAQDLRISHRRMPTLPNSGFVIERVRRCSAGGGGRG
jgi:fatty-acid peroxygenase